MRILPVGILCLAACASSSHEGGEQLVVYAASSLARPLGAALGAHDVRLVVGGSLDLVRRMTELGETPDLVILADEEVMRSLVPSHADGYARFARNRLVLAYGPRTRASISESTWMHVLTRHDVEVARADPARAPVGYRTELAWQLAEEKLALPGLADRLRNAASLRNVRGSEAELLALVENGDADFAWAYESSARAAGLSVLRLPAWMDFGEPEDSAFYARATTKVRSGTGTPGDSMTVTGAAVAYVLTVPRNAPNRQRAQMLAAFLLGADARRALSSAGLDVLPSPVIIGDDWLQ